MTIGNEALKRALEARNTAWVTMAGLLETCERDGVEWTGEQRASFEKAHADLKRHDADMKLIESAQRAEGETAAITTEQRTAPVGGPEATTRGTKDPKAEERYAEVFGRFVRRGINRLSSEDRDLMEARYESRAQSEGTGSAGGYLIPQGYLASITVAMKAYGGLYNIARVIETTTGNVLPWPNMDDTANSGRILSENTTLTETDVVLGTRTLNAWTYTSDLVLASLQLIQDSAFDVEGFVTEALGIRIGRAIAGDFMNGSGTNKPLGIASAPTLGWTQTVTGKGGIAQYIDLINTLHSVNVAYRQGGNCRWVMADAGVAGLRSLVDTQNRPLWLPALTVADEDTMLGFPITVDEGLAAPAVNAVSILFGDFNAGYIIRKVKDIQMVTLHERYADALQVGYFGFARFDGRPDNAAAVKGFKGAAS